MIHADGFHNPSKSIPHGVGRIAIINYQLLWVALQATEFHLLACRLPDGDEIPEVSKMLDEIKAVVRHMLKDRYGSLVRGTDPVEVFVVDDVILRLMFSDGSLEIGLYVVNIPMGDDTLDTFDDGPSKPRTFYYGDPNFVGQVIADIETRLETWRNPQTTR